MLIQLQKLGLKGKLFRDSTRLFILESLSKGEKYAPQIEEELNQSQTNVSELQSSGSY
jgi:Bacterial regulatory protein, arsR family